MEVQSEVSPAASFDSKKVYDIQQLAEKSLENHVENTNSLTFNTHSEEYDRIIEGSKINRPTVMEANDLLSQFTNDKEVVHAETSISSNVERELFPSEKEQQVIFVSSDISEKGDSFGTPPEVNDKNEILIDLGDCDTAQILRTKEAACNFSNQTEEKYLDLEENVNDITVSRKDDNVDMNENVDPSKDIEGNLADENKGDKKEQHSEESSCYYIIVNGSEIHKLTEAEFELAQKEGFEVQLQPVSSEMDIQKHLNAEISKSMQAQSHTQSQDYNPQALNGNSVQTAIAYVNNINDSAPPPVNDTPSYYPNTVGVSLSPSQLPSTNLAGNDSALSSSLEASLGDENFIANLSRTLGIQQILPNNSDVFFGTDHGVTMDANERSASRSLPGAIIHTCTQPYTKSSPSLKKSTLSHSYHMKCCNLVTTHPQTGQIIYVPHEGSPPMHYANPPHTSTPVLEKEKFPCSRLVRVNFSPMSVALNSSGEENLSGEALPLAEPPYRRGSPVGDHDNVHLPLFDQNDQEGRQQHNMKERKRRARIKDACDVMRKLVPGMSEKTDKATVFEFGARYIHYLKSYVGTKHDKNFLIKYSPY